jgi:hypothetical protein
MQHSPPPPLQPDTIGTIIGSVVAVDGDLGDNGILAYSLVQSSPSTSQPSFVIHPYIGRLSIAAIIDPNTDYQLVVTATVSSVCH